MSINFGMTIVFILHLFYCTLTQQLLKMVSVEEGGHLTIPRSWSPGVQLGVQPPPLDHMLPEH